MMMLGVGAMGLMSILLEEKDNEYTHPHDYYVSGAYGPKSVTGTGNSVYINESEREYLYQFTTTVNGCDVPKFNVICDSSRKPTDLYERLGEVTVDDEQLSRYRYVFEGATFTFDMDEKMAVHHYTIVSDGYSLEAKMVS